MTIEARDRLSVVTTDLACLTRFTGKMASFLCRAVNNVARRTATLTSVRCMSGVVYVDPHKGKVGKLLQETFHNNRLILHVQFCP